MVRFGNLNPLNLPIFQRTATATAAPATTIMPAMVGDLLDVAMKYMDLPRLDEEDG